MRTENVSAETSIAVLTRAAASMRRPSVRAGRSKHGSYIRLMG
jgi:hypothetical protein